MLTKTNKFLILAFISIGLVFLTSGTVNADRPVNVKICHATGSDSNPYIVNNPAKSADVAGHDGHNGPIWFSGIDEDWGDIIPPFDYEGGSYPGKNWTSEGQAIWDNDCDIPEEEEPEDVCENLEGVQEETPDGYLNDGGYCYVPEEPIDVCENLEGIQEETPEGYVNEQGNCTIPEEEPEEPKKETEKEKDKVFSEDTRNFGGGEVLGASTLGATGAVEETIIASMLSLGGASLGMGVRRYAPKNSQKN